MDSYVLCILHQKIFRILQVPEGCLRISAADLRDSLRFSRILGSHFRIFQDFENRILIEFNLTFNSIDFNQFLFFSRNLFRFRIIPSPSLLLLGFFEDLLEIL